MENSNSLREQIEAELLAEIKTSRARIEQLREYIYVNGSSLRGTSKGNAILTQIRRLEEASGWCEKITERYHINTKNCG